MTRPVATVGVSAIVQKGDRFLIGKRGPACSRGSGLYAFPGGVQYADEFTWDCAIREVKEETNLDIRCHPQPSVVLSPYGTVGMTISRSSDGRMVFWVPCLWLRNEPILMEVDKCEGWEWLTIEQIQAIPGVYDCASPQHEWLPMTQLYSMLFRLTS